MKINKQKIFLTLSVATILIVGYFGFSRIFQPDTLEDDLSGIGTLGESVNSDLIRTPAVPIAKADDGYEVSDSLQQGIQIDYANQKKEGTEEKALAGQAEFKINFPADYAEPIEVRLDEERAIQITDANGGKYADQLLVEKMALTDGQDGEVRQTPEAKYLKYSSGRKSAYYAYQKDQAQGERKLKHWTVYQNADSDQAEQESYVFQNAKLKLGMQGEVQVYYFGDKQIQNEKTMAEVEPSLLERAQRTIAKEEGEDILNGNRTPDFIVSEPYYLNKDGKKTVLKWEVDSEKNSISLAFAPKEEEYPVALDPTLQFTASGSSNSASVIDGEAGSRFGTSLAAGDFNDDGMIDLAVGGFTYSSNTGRVYIFYNTGSIDDAADAVITGEAASSYFGYLLIAEDFNADGKKDLAVGAYIYSSDTGRAYIFYNDGILPDAASAADAIITGEAAGDYFGISLAAGDFNADGKIDLAVGAYYNSSQDGRVYVFYNDGSYPSSASAADVIIAGEEAAAGRFGYSLVAGDFNADGKVDLAVGGYVYDTAAGRAYVFYNDGSIPTAASSADVIITGETSSYFGFSLAAGDFNSDGRTDLAVGARYYSSNIGRAYIFHNDGSIPTDAASADVIITGETVNNFGMSMAAGDLNSDGREDLIVGAYIATDVGKVYVFYNDGSMPSAASSADVIIVGETVGNQFGRYLYVDDFNIDGKADLAVTENFYASGTGRAYIFYSQNGQVNTNFSITGGSASRFGVSLAAGDFNSDGRIDLAAGAHYASSYAGRVYIFYNDGSIPATVATADAVIDGEVSSYFGFAMVSGDFNSDSKTDLAVGGYGYSSTTGRVYIFHNDGSIPTTADAADVIITGEVANNYFGISLAAGDLDTDGRTDLVVGAYGYSTSTGRAYIFHNDGAIPTTADAADNIITGETTYNNFGYGMATGDFNADGRTDLAVGVYRYDAYTGRAYIFHNDGSIPTDAASADVIITGEAVDGRFGISVAAGDFNADGRTDLAVGASTYSTNAGRAYIFHNDGSIPTTADAADVIIDGEASSYFGYSMVAGDFNIDGRTDLVVGGYTYSSNTGRAYFFYNDSSIAATASAADIIITGEASSNDFGFALAAGDFNADGRTDLAVGAWGYSASDGRVYIYETRDDFAWQLPDYTTGIRVNDVAGQELKITGEMSGGYFGQFVTVADLNSDGRNDLVVSAHNFAAGSGRVYIFYNDGSISNNAASADVIITGEASSRFGISTIAGDFNADGRTDLVVGGDYYITQTGRVYIFYNDGSYPASAADADAIITGRATTDRFGQILASGDLNSDGRDDLVVGAPLYGTNAGRVYVFYNDSDYPASSESADKQISAEGNSDYFGIRVKFGDLNSDGKKDLVVGAYYYNTYTGRTYIFYNDELIPTTAATADVIITGEGTYSNFGTNIICGDINNDGRTDLIVGANQYNTYTGRAYIFYNDGLPYPDSASAADVIITGEGTYNNFGASFVFDDLNSDGLPDLAIGATRYETYTGRVYVFYNDGSIPTSAADADVILTGESTNSGFGFINSGDLNSDGRPDLLVGASWYSAYKGRLYVYTFNDSQTTGSSGERLGSALVSGDFNADGKTDLAVGARAYATNTGRVYVFYSDNSIPSASSSADATITGEAENNYFGRFLAAGDFNADGKTDLAVGASWYATYTGRAYIFYNDGSYPILASSADATITGEATNNYFGVSLAAGDFNADGKTDLVVGAISYSSTGRVYVFQNDGSYPADAVSADTIISGEGGQFGMSIETGDFNADGRVDLAIGANLYASSAGRVYIFHNDGAYPATADLADATITGEAAGDYFGWHMASGDFNADGKTDLAVGAQAYETNTGRAYVFYNDGSYAADASSADVIITGQSATSFGASLASGDFNADGKTDLAVGAFGYSLNTGRTYVFYYSVVPPIDVTAADLVMTGEAESDYFGILLAAGDFNSDGKTDLAVSADAYGASNDGKFYVFLTEAKTSTIQTGTKINGIIRLDQGVVNFR